MVCAQTVGTERLGVIPEEYIGAFGPRLMNLIAILIQEPV